MPDAPVSDRSPDRLLDGLNEAQREAVVATSGPARDHRGRRDPARRGSSATGPRYAIETGRRRGGPNPARDVHGQGGDRDGRADADAGPSRRDGQDVPCPRARAAPHVLAVAPRRRADAAGPRELAPAAVPAGAPAARRVCVHARRGTSPTRSRGRRSAGSGRSAGPPRREPRAPSERRSRPSCSRASTPTTSARKARTGVIDFDDMLIETVDLLEGDQAAAELVRSRKTWFSVDEYQDTNPLAERLLELWLGASRDIARRRGPGPDHLHVHRREQRVPARPSRRGTRARRRSPSPTTTGARPRSSRSRTGCSPRAGASAASSRRSRPDRSPPSRHLPTTTPSSPMS